MNLYPLLSTFTYSSSGLTQSATFAINVQGVVVHARKYSSLSFTLNDKTTEFTSTSLYPSATSCVLNSVPQRGQYGSIL